MTIIRHKILVAPARLELQELADWSVQLRTDFPIKNALFDFRRTVSATPSGLLVAASIVRRYKRKAFAAHYNPIDLIGADIRTPEYLRRLHAGEFAPPDIRIIRASKCDFAERMGFWETLEPASHREEGKTHVKARTIAVSSVKTEDIKLEARRKHREDGDIVVELSERLAELLTQSVDDELETTVAYAVRELIRNIVEHSEAPIGWYCAHYDEENDFVEIAILDEGIGIAESLRRSQKYDVPSDFHAIELATEKGITKSRPMPRLKTVSGEDTGSRYENSGWGLYVLRKLAEDAGSIVIISNDAAVEYDKSGRKDRLFNFSGTCVQLRIKPSLLHNLIYRILETSTSEGAPTWMTASMVARIRNSWM